MGASASDPCRTAPARSSPTRTLRSSRPPPRAAAVVSACAARSKARSPRPARASASASASASGPRGWGASRGRRKRRRCGEVRGDELVRPLELAELRREHGLAATERACPIRVGLERAPAERLAQRVLPRATAEFVQRRRLRAKQGHAGAIEVVRGQHVPRLQARSATTNFSSARPGCAWVARATRQREAKLDAAGGAAGHALGGESQSSTFSPRRLDRMSIAAAAPSPALMIAWLRPGRAERPTT